VDVYFAYFPCGGSIVSFEILLNDGKPVGTTLIGREGTVGGFFSHSYLPAYMRARVLLPGRFLRIALTELEKVKKDSAALRCLFTAYSECLRAQLHQTAACNAAHTMEQRAAKWLCCAKDRTGTDAVPLTQEELANILGVSRTHVSRVIQRLKGMGVIETHRGGLLIRDALLLRRLSCDCHDAVLNHFETVLKGVYPSEAPGLFAHQAARHMRPHSTAMI
jgi:biotin operon repressor